MSRHRIVRTMNYEDEYYDEEDEYSHSVEDNYCISPSTAAQFTWTREKNMDFAAYVGQEAVINEEEETQEDVSQSGCDSFNDSVKSAQLGLSELDQAKLNSCLEEARNILGDSVSETVMTSVIIQNGYNLETSINQLLSQQDAPKPQREPRQRKNRTQDDIDTTDLDNLLAEIEGVDMPKNKTFQPKINSCHLPTQNLVSAMNISSFKSNNSSTVSLSDLIKQQQKVEKKSIPSTVHRVDDPVARSDHSVSLTELARQHKKGISPVRSVPQANSVPKAHVLGFTNLSDLIADYPKGSNSSTRDLSFGSLSPYATQSLISLSNPTVKTKLDNSQTASPSLSELVKQHSVSQSEKNKTDLNVPTSPPFVKDFATLSLGGLVATLSLSSLTKDLSLDKSKSHDTDSVISSSSASTVLPDSFSLASCLKTKNSSSLKSPHLKQVDQDKKERLFVQEFRVNVHPGLMKGSIIQKVDTSLVSQASYFGLVLCGPYRKRKSDQFSSVKQRGVKHPKFLCTAQLCKVPMYKHTLHHFIKPFDFSTPSPDDIVKNKQKQAFTRSDKEFTI